MAKLSCAFALLGLVLVGTHAYVNVESCTNIENCFHFFESPGCTDGKRQVCISFRSGGGCAILDYDDSVYACLQNNIPYTEELEDGEQLCDDSLVPGGSFYTFGIQSKFTTANTHSGNVVITNYANNPATCRGFTNVCSVNGNNDFALTFKVSECPTAPPTTAPPPSCQCSPWVNDGYCSTTCGTGLQAQKRSCSSSCPSPTQTMRYISCPNQPSCPGTTSKPPVNGVWGPWGGFSTCTATCGGGTQRRTRVCNNPPPSNGGLNCPSSASEERLCNVQTCTTKRPPGCRKLARKGACRGLRRKALRRCIRRECAIKG